MFDHKQNPEHLKWLHMVVFNINSLLECSGEMLTKFYSAEIAPAQGVMLRNFLGILAQKVTDVRQELFLVRDGRDIFNPNAEEKN